MIKHKFAYEPHNLFYFNQEFFHYPINGKPSIYHFFPNIEKFLFNKRVLDVGAGLGHLKKLFPDDVVYTGVEPAIIHKKTQLENNVQIRKILTKDIDVFDVFIFWESLYQKGVAEVATTALNKGKIFIIFDNYKWNDDFFEWFLPKCQILEQEKVNIDKDSLYAIIDDVYSYQKAEEVKRSLFLDKFFFTILKT